METEQARTLLKVTELVNRTGLVPVLDAIVMYMDLESREKDLDEKHKQQASVIAGKLDAVTDEISELLTSEPTT